MRATPFFFFPLRGQQSSYFRYELCSLSRGVSFSEWHLHHKLHTGSMMAPNFSPGQAVGGCRESYVAWLHRETYWLPLMFLLNQFPSPIGHLLHYISFGKTDDRDGWLHARGPICGGAARKCFIISDLPQERLDALNKKMHREASIPVISFMTHRCSNIKWEIFLSLQTYCTVICMLMYKYIYRIERNSPVTWLCQAWSHGVIWQQF